MPSSLEPSRRRFARSLARAIPAALLLSFLASGCAAGWRAGGGPLVDTDGGVALTAGAGLAFGFRLDDAQALVETLDAGVGPSLRSEAGVLTAAVGLDWLHQEVGDALGLRAGLRGRYAGRFGAQGWERHAFGPGGALALLFVLDERSHAGHEKWGGGSRTWRNISLELQAFWAPVVDTDRAGGLFLLLVGYEAHSLVDFF